MTPVSHVHLKSAVPSPFPVTNLSGPPLHFNGSGSMVAVHAMHLDGWGFKCEPSGHFIEPCVYTVAGHCWRGRQHVRWESLDSVHMFIVAYQKFTIEQTHAWFLPFIFNPQICKSCPLLFPFAANFKKSLVCKPLLKQK